MAANEPDKDNQPLVRSETSRELVRFSTSLVRRSLELVRDIENKKVVERVEGDGREISRGLMEGIDAIVRAIYEAKDAEILRIAAQRLSEALAADRCAIVSLVKESPTAKYLEFCKHGVASCPANKTANLNFSLLKKVSSGRNVLTIDDTMKEAGLQEFRAELEEFKIRALMAYPLFCNSELIGLIIVHRCAKGLSWTEQEKTLFSMVSNHLALACSRSARNEAS